MTLAQTKIAEAVRAHARASASSSDRWMPCPGSINLCESLQLESADTIYTLRGRAGHKAGEMLIANPPDCVKVGDLYDPDTDTIVPFRKDAPDHFIALTQDLMDQAEVYSTFVRALRGDAIMLEQRLDLSRWIAGGFSTADALVIVGRNLHVVDLKTGIVDVEPDCSQLHIYGAGALDLVSPIYDIDEVVLTIVQPRSYTPAKTHRITADALIAWADNTLAPAAAATLDPNAPLHPGEKQCRWCPAKAYCPALAQRAIETAFGEFATVANCPPEPIPMSHVTDVQLGDLLHRVGLVEIWVKALRERAFATLRAGKNAGVPGWKLVEGRSLRRWTDEQLAAQQLRSLGYSDDDIYTRSLLSPAQAEKLVSRSDHQHLQQVIVKPEGRPTLVPEPDRRKPMTFATAHDDFAADAQQET